MLKPDAWLSQILGKPAWHLSGADFSAPSGPAFVDAKVAASDTVTLLALQAQGFAVMDVNVQLVRPPASLPPCTIRVRDADAHDAASVRKLASAAFVYDRFHRDPAIGHAAAGQLKAEWADNYFTGRRGDRMILAEDGDGVCGFLQLLTGPDGAMVIDLIAVDKRSRGKGFARAMIAQAAAAGRAMRVGTQIANLPSLALYESLGFRMTSASFVLHLHTGNTP
jgi:ribosomal protein S18 acetylase RimI-like enzyme